MEQKSDKFFNGTDWMTLELAIEVIGDMIGFYSQQLHIAIKNKANSATITNLDMKIVNLGKERQMCYDRNSNSEIIFKALTVYACQLRKICEKSTSS